MDTLLLVVNKEENGNILSVSKVFAFPLFLAYAKAFLNIFFTNKCSKITI